MKKYIQGILLFITIILFVFSCCLIYQEVCFMNIVVIGTSMNSILKEGDIGLAKKMKYVTSLKRGNIIIFNREDKEVVKRVIGLPGEKVDIDKNGQIFINNDMIKENYLDEEAIQNTFRIVENITYPIVLEENQYFVLGDNRKDSYDSRFYGPIQKEQIIGKLKLINYHCTCLNNTCSEYCDKKMITWKYF